MSLQSSRGRIQEGLLSDKPKLISLLSKLLQQILDATSQTPRGSSVYHTGSFPSMPIRQYLHRIQKFYRCSTSCYILALAYIDLYQEINEQFAVNKFCIHKLFLTAITVAAKFNDDHFFKNSYYARVGGITTEELNKLEKAFLISLDYKIVIKRPKFQQYLRKLIVYEEFGV